MAKTLRKLALLFAATLIASGCTPKSSSKNSNVQFQIPLRKAGVGASAAGDLAHAIVNVRGAGINPVIFCSWDRNESGIVRASGSCAFDASVPTAISISVSNIPSGADRLIQVLLAYDAATATSTSTKAIDIYYGDTVKSLDGGDVPAGITVGKVGASASAPAMVRGRYLTSATDGPSGLLEVKVKAASDKPAMTLMVGEMLSGWFETMAFAAIPIESWVNGNLLFGKAMLLSDFDALATAAGQKVLSSTSGGETRYVGYFGDSAAIGGRVACSSGCAGTEFVDYLTPNSGWRGPFRGNVSVTASGITWAALPGVPALLEGYRAFRLNNADPGIVGKFMVDHGSFDCDIARNVMGGDWLTLDPNSTGITAAQLGTFTPTKDLIVVCPMRGGRLLRNAFVSPNPDSGGGSNMPYFRIELSGSSYNNTLYRDEILADNCYPAQVKAYTYDGVSSNPYNNSSTNAWSLALAATGWAGFYTSSNCTGGTSTTTVSVPVGSNSSGQFFVKTTAGIATNTTYTFTMTGMPSDVQYQSSNNPYYVSTPKYRLLGPTVAGTNICYPYSVGVQTMAGSPLYQFNGTASINLVDGSANPVNVFATYGDCVLGTPPFSPSLTTTNSSANFYYKASGNYTLVAKTKTSSLTVADSDPLAGTVDPNQSGIGSQLKIVVQGTGNGSAGTWDSCYWADAILVNEAGNEVAARAKMDFSIKFASPGFGFVAYNDSTCTTANQITGPLTIFPGNSRRSFGFRILGAAAPGTILNFDTGRPDRPLATGSSTLTPGLPSGPFARIVMPPQLSGSRLLGSHEFATGGGSNRALNVVSSPGTTIALDCLDSNNAAVGCVSTLSGNTVAWSMTDIGLGYRLRLKASMSGFADQYSIFDPADYIPSGLKVIPCDTIVTGTNADLTQVAGSLVSATTGILSINASAKICLAQNASIAMAGRFDLGLNSAIIGWSDRSSQIISTDPSYNIISTNAASTMVANATLKWSTNANAGVAMINVSNVNAGTSIFANLSLDGNSSNNSVIGFNLALNTSPHQVWLGNIDAKLGADGVFASTQHNNSLVIHGAQFFANASSSFPASFLKMAGSAGTDSVDIVGLRVQNQASPPGPAFVNLLSSSSSTTNTKNVTITDAFIDSANGAGATQSVLPLLAGSIFNLTNVTIANDSLKPAIEVVSKSASFSLNSSTLISKQDVSAFYFNPITASGSQAGVSIGGTEFIRSGPGTGGSSAAIRINDAQFNTGSGENISISNPGGGYVAPTFGNQICGVSGSPTWNTQVSFDSGNSAALNVGGNFSPTSVPIGVSFASATGLHCR